MRKVEEIEIPKPIAGGSMYTEMYERQSNLVKAYVSKGKQPPFPIDLNQKEYQKFLREILGYLEEEIIEGFEHIEKICYERENLKPKEFAELIKEYNVEQADAMHLFIEVLQYCNITDWDLRDYYNQFFTLTDQEHLKHEDPLVAAFNHAKSIDYFVGQRSKVSFRLEIPINPPELDDLYTAGRKTGATPLSHSADAIFQVFKNLKKATNQLKNKYWKETESEVNMEVFHQLLMEAWLHYIHYIHINGFTAESVRATYIRKNEVNLDRLKHKY